MKSNKQLLDRLIQLAGDNEVSLMNRDLLEDTRDAVLAKLEGHDVRIRMLETYIKALESSRYLPLSVIERSKQKAYSTK